MRRLKIAVFLGLTIASPAGAQERAGPADSAAAVHLLRRATFGVRPADVGQVVELGRTAWLDRQLHPERIEDGALASRLAPFSAAGASVAVLIRDYTPPRPQLQDSLGRREMTAEERRQAQQQNPQRILADLVGAKLVRSAWSERQLEEVMTDFWFNHFNVYFGKGLDRYLVGAYEREAIRPHVFGKFEDLLLATAKHPAMLFYLDNWTSQVPDSLNPDAVQRRRQAEARVRRLLLLSDEERDRLVRSGRVSLQEKARLEELARLSPTERQALLDQQQKRGERGINENYARELMELHTLGVDGGYTQHDVVEVARALTGWTFVRPGQRGGLRQGRPGDLLGGGDGGFTFNAGMHDRGEKVVLGRRLAAGRGIEDGNEVMHILATHPSTAKFLATKLVERFVSDTPDPAFVEELAGVFTRTGGDLREVTRTLFSSPRFYEAKNVGTKVKTPFEVVASALRVTRAQVVQPRPLMETLRGLGQLPYFETAPTGFPAASEEWVNSGAMLARMNFGLGLATGQLQGARPNAARPPRPARRGGAGGIPAGVEGVHAIVAMLLPGVDATRLETAIEADLKEQPTTQAAPRAAVARAAGLTLGSPEFQRR